VKIHDAIAALEEYVSALESQTKAQDELIVLLQRGSAARDEIISCHESTIASQRQIIDILRAQANVEGWQPPATTEPMAH